MTWTCTACGQVNDDSNQFCATCLLDKQPGSASTPQQVQTSQPEPSAVTEVPTSVPSSSAPEEPPPPPSAPQQVAPQAVNTRYAVVFVNSPATALIGTKIPLEFDLFPVISVGRSPENILAIPDQEVSRKHAEITISGDGVHVKDLTSTNGTHIFDGKAFQPVTGETTLKPNAIVKFGLNTIIRIVAE